MLQADAWAVLQCFGYDRIMDDLNGAGVHRLENILTLRADVCSYFDQLSLWFEPLVSSTVNITLAPTKA